MPVTKPSAVLTYPRACTAARSVVKASDQLPMPLPTPSTRPLSGLPRSRSVELKCVVCRGASVSSTGPNTLPRSSMARIATLPCAPVRLLTRTKPCCWEFPAGRKSGRMASSSNTREVSIEDKLAKLPVGTSSKFITSIAVSDSTVKDHLPTRSPKAPFKPSPRSSWRDVTVRAVPAGKVSRTGPGWKPRSSRPRISTAAVRSPGLTRRNLLTWRVLLAGLKNGTE